MSVVTAIKSKVANGSVLAQAKGLLSALNLHWAGVGLLALVNLYLLAQMGFLWHAESNHNAEAMAQQRIALKTAGIAAQPLRGLDAKLARATQEEYLRMVRKLAARTGGDPSGLDEAGLRAHLLRLVQHRLRKPELECLGHK